MSPSVGPPLALRVRRGAAITSERRKAIADTVGKMAKTALRQAKTTKTGPGTKWHGAAVRLGTGYGQNN